MKLGIKKIEYIQSALCRDFSYYSRNSSIKLSGFISNSLQELPFTQDSASFEEKWDKESAGGFSSIKISGVIRANKEEYSDTLQQLFAGHFVYVVTTVSGVVYVIGSRESPARLVFNNTISALSTSEYSFTITCESLHGALFVEE